MSPRKRIGVIIPSTNTTCEADFQMTVPRDVTIHGQRLWLTNDSNGDDAYVRMNGEIESAARYLAGNQGINDQDPEEVADFAARVCRPEADALLCSCTAWRSVEAIAAIEARTGKPVVSSNQSTIWTALRALGITRPITGFGRLLEHLAPARLAPAAR